jgi:hypothetical protein
MVRLTPKRSPSASSGNLAPGSSACSMIARRSARQIVPTLSADFNGFAVSKAIGSRGSAPRRKAVARIACMSLRHCPTNFHWEQRYSETRQISSGSGLASQLHAL